MSNNKWNFAGCCTEVRHKSAKDAVLGSIIGGLVLYLIISHIIFILKRNRNISDTALSPVEDQYDEVETFNYDLVLNENLHIPQNFEINNTANNVSSSSASDNTSSSSPRRNFDINETAEYEHPYQPINLELIAVHTYSKYRSEQQNLSSLLPCNENEPENSDKIASASMYLVGFKKSKSTVLSTEMSVIVGKDVWKYKRNTI